MWARVAELMLGVWLMMSPFVFRGTASVDWFMPIDFGVGALVILLSLLSFWRWTAWAHFATALLALALGLTAYVSWPPPGPPAAQNELTVAMFLVLLAIVPNEANQPPKPWRAGT